MVAINAGHSSLGMSNHVTSVVTKTMAMISECLSIA
jgi:hypothetical protein